MSWYDNVERKDCGNSERYAAKRKPRCACLACWSKWEHAEKERSSHLPTQFAAIRDDGACE